MRPNDTSPAFTVLDKLQHPVLLWYLPKHGKYRNRTYLADCAHSQQFHPDNTTPHFDFVNLHPLKNHQHSMFYAPYSNHAMLVMRHNQSRKG